MVKKRWQRRKDARAPEILEAALACFAQKGFAGTRMDDIARLAGVSPSTVSQYFHREREKRREAKKAAGK